MAKDDVIICYDRDTQKPIIMPQTDRFLNTLVVGPTGTGKTSQILLPLILQDLANPNVGVVVFDPKEDLALRVKELAGKINNRKFIYVDPMDDLCPKVDLFAGSSTQISDVLSRIFSTTSKYDSNAERDNKYVIRTLIDKSINILKEFPMLCGNNLNIDSYCEFIGDRYGQSKVKLTKLMDNLRNTNKNRRIADCRWLLEQYFNLETGIFDKCSSFRSRLEELVSNYYLQNVFNAEGGRGILVNFDEHIANGDIVIINTKNTLLGYLGRIFGEILMYLYVSAVFRRFSYNEQRGVRYIKPNFLYIDEFASFMPVTIDLFTQGRAFKVGTYITIQNRTLLKMCGNLDTTNEAFIIESNTRNLILFPGLNGEDAEYYASQFFNLSPSQILYRPFGQVVYKIVKNKNTIPPSVGLVFFINEMPNASSIAKEFSFDDTGRIIWTRYNDFINDDFE